MKREGGKEERKREEVRKAGKLGGGRQRKGGRGTERGRERFSASTQEK